MIDTRAPIRRQIQNFPADIGNRRKNLVGIPGFEIVRFLSRARDEVYPRNRETDRGYFICVDSSLESDRILGVDLDDLAAPPEAPAEPAK